MTVNFSSLLTFVGKAKSFFFFFLKIIRQYFSFRQFHLPTLQVSFSRHTLEHFHLNFRIDKAAHQLLQNRQIILRWLWGLFLFQIVCMCAVGNVKWQHDNCTVLLQYIFIISFVVLSLLCHFYFHHHHYEPFIFLQLLFVITTLLSVSLWVQYGSADAI